MVASVPPSLRQLVRRWRLDGRPTQPAIKWPRQSWIDAFPRHKAMLRALPDHLDRRDVRASCEGAASSARSAETALIVTMAWGYARNGYGPVRARDALSTTPGATRRLAAAASTLAEQGPVAAYQRLARANDCRVANLGPAFGTKFLYFCQRPNQRVTALVLDSLVSEWLAREAGLDATSKRWSTSAYSRYLEHMHAWAESLDCQPDELEYCIFRTMSRERGNQWADPG